MAIKIILSLLLLSFIAIQCFFIYLLGYTSVIVDLWRSFDMAVMPYTDFMIRLAKSHWIWVIPMTNLIIGVWLIIKANWKMALLPILLALILMMMWVMAVYSVSLIVNNMNHFTN